MGCVDGVGVTIPLYEYNMRERGVYDIYESKQHI